MCLHTCSFTSNDTSCDMVGLHARGGCVNHKAHHHSKRTTDNRLTCVRTSAQDAVNASRGQQRHGQTKVLGLHARRSDTKQDGGQMGGLFWESVCAVSGIASCASTAPHFRAHILTSSHSPSFLCGRPRARTRALNAHHHRILPVLFSISFAQSPSHPHTNTQLWLRDHTR
jgi:hypothetical protein